jgi:hypothetical protein
MCTCGACSIGLRAAAGSFPGAGSGCWGSPGAAVDVDLWPALLLQHAASVTAPGSFTALSGAGQPEALASLPGGAAAVAIWLSAHPAMGDSTPGLLPALPVGTACKLVARVGTSGKRPGERDKAP